MWFLERFLWPCSGCKRGIIQQKENCRQEATGSEAARRKRTSLETKAVMESGCKLRSGSVLGNSNGRERKVKIQELFDENWQEIKWMMRLQMWEREKERQCVCPWLGPETSECAGQSILKMSDSKVCLIPKPVFFPLLHTPRELDFHCHHSPSSHEKSFYKCPQSYGHLHTDTHMCAHLHPPRRGQILFFFKP